MSNYSSYKLFVIFILYIFSCAFNTIYAQQQKLVDSLLHEIQVSTSDSSRFHLFHQLSHIQKHHNPNIAIKYAQKSLFFAEKAKNYTGIALANRNIGALFFGLGKMDEAYTYQLKALEIWQQKNISNVDREIAVCLNNLGTIHVIRGDWYEALECFNKALDSLGESKEDRRTIIEILSNIGVVYAEQKNYKKAYIYHKQVLKRTSEDSDSLGISIALTNIGETHYSLNEADKALAFYVKALAIAKSIDDVYGIGYLYTNMGVIHYERGAIELAEDYLEQAMVIANKLDATTEKIRIYTTLGRVEQNKKNYISANKYCKKGLALATQMKSKTYIKNLYELLAQNHELQKEPTQALSYYKLFKETNDTLFNIEKNRQISELSIQYETKKKEAENQFLKEEQAKNKALLERRTTLNWTVFLFLILVSVIAYGLFINNKRKHKYNQLLEEKVEKRTKALKNSNAQLKRSNKDLEQFAFITSHDLKEPLRNISSFTSLIKKRFGDSIDLESKKDISFIQRNVHQMDTLIESLLSYSRIENLNHDNEEVDLKQVISKLKEVLKSTIEENNVKILVEHLPTVAVNPSQILIIFRKLVENAIKYNTSQQPTIHISSVQVKEMYHIEVKDNGIGIDKEFQDNIFVIFKRLHSRSVYDGAGVGLSICKRIVQSLGGEIWVKSKKDKGSRFIFSIPVSSNSQA